MTEHSILEASAENADLIVRLIHESFQDVAARFLLTPENCPKHPSNCTTAWIKADQARGVRYFVLTLNRTPVGCAGLERNDDRASFLERLCVLPEHRRKGLGTLLVDHVLSEAEAMSASVLGVAIIADHTELKQWYVSQGFVETGKRTYGHLPFAVMFLERKIRKSANHQVEDIVANAPNLHP